MFCKDREYVKWQDSNVGQVPSLYFDPKMEVKIAPSHTWALARLIVNWFSIYYDIDASLWFMWEPYWGIFSWKECFRFLKWEEKELIQKIRDLTIEREVENEIVKQIIDLFKINPIKYKEYEEKILDIIKYNPK